MQLLCFMQCSGVKELIACYTSFAYIYKNSVTGKYKRIWIHAYRGKTCMCVFIYILPVSSPNDCHKLLPCYCHEFTDAPLLIRDLLSRNLWQSCKGWDRSHRFPCSEGVLRRDAHNLKRQFLWELQCLFPGANLNIFVLSYLFDFTEIAP